MIDITQGVANRSLISWVEEIAALTQPDRVHWCDGTESESAQLCDEMVEHGQPRGDARAPFGRELDANACLRPGHSQGRVPPRAVL